MYFEVGIPLIIVGISQKIIDKANNRNNSILE